MFGRIVGRYDLLNDLMTAGRHRHWKRLTAEAADPAGAFALDLGSGTGDIARELARRGACHVVSADFVPAMLHLAASKARQHDIDSITFTVADALALPFAEATFDCVTSGFLVRNTADPERAFREMYRVLKPGGRVVCLEAARRDDVIGRCLIAAFGVVARVLGHVVAGDPEAYTYLPGSAARFANPIELAAIMHRTGFQDVRYHLLGLGLIAIHRAQRPSSSSG